MERYSILDVEIIEGVYHIPSGWSGKRFMRWMKRYRKLRPKPMKRTKYPIPKEANATTQMKRTKFPVDKQRVLSGKDAYAFLRKASVIFLQKRRK